MDREEIRMYNPNIPIWETWSDDVVSRVHGDLTYYRELYYGNHGELFQRAKDLIDDGEITDNITHGYTTNTKGNVRTPYIVANVSKLIPEIPALFVSRAIGKMSIDQDVTFNVDGEETQLSTIVEEIVKDSKLTSGHYSNILQHQIDGGIVGIPVKDENGIRIDFKKRELYFPHEDGLGCDLAYKRRLMNQEGEMKDYLHIHRERVEERNLATEEVLYSLSDNALQPIDEEEAKWLLGVDTLTQVYEGRSRPLVCYWANEATFDFPLGVSSLLNQGNKQDEINWTLTRLGIVYERNGKPRLAISKEVMTALQQKAFERYGDEGRIDHRDLELVTIDENGRHLEVVQIDISKIGSISWVKDLMKLMFMETKTSEKAVDFYLDGGASGAQSGVAKFYDLFISIIKAEKIAAEYVEFLQELFENCLWLLAQDEGYEETIIQRPSIAINDMLPTTRKERIETEVMAKSGGIRSTERAVRNVNPTDSDASVMAEIERIEEDAASVNSNSGLPVGLNTLSAMLDNRDKPLVNTAQEGTEAGTEGGEGEEGSN